MLHEAEYDFIIVGAVVLMLAIYEMRQVRTLGPPAS